MPVCLQKLKRHADDRNPDEFYFAMQRSETKDGVHVVRTAEANKYSQSELALMRTQDIAYLRTRSQAESRVRPCSDVHCTPATYAHAEDPT